MNDERHDGASTPPTQPADEQWIITSPWEKSDEPRQTQHMEWQTDLQSAAFQPTAAPSGEHRVAPASMSRPDETVAPFSMERPSAAPDPEFMIESNSRRAVMLGIVAAGTTGVALLIFGREWILGLVGL